MSDAAGAGFGKFVPGFDFLQTLAKGAAQSIPQMPGVGNWIAPTLSVEELDKRIDELKAVQFWLDQNAMALKATIQALEVQKMTLATLKGMNLSMGDLADAFRFKAPEAAGEARQPAAKAPEPTRPAVAPTPRATDEADTKARAPAPEGKAGAAEQAAPGVVDPLQWWNALTQQFQQIATAAMQEAGAKNPLDGMRAMAAGRSKPTPQGRETAARPAAKKAAAKRPAAGKSAARKRGA